MQVPSASSSPIHLLAGRRPQTLDRPQARPGASATLRTRPASETFPSPVKIRDGAEAPEKRTPLQKLLADWGKKGWQYDLNGNGTVDVPDLLMMLRQMAPGGPDDNPPAVIKLPPAVDPKRPIEPERPKSPLEQLKADWGKKDSVYDLNGNGTVDVPDLLMMLARMAPGDSNDTPPPVEKPPPTLNPDRPPVEPEKPLSPLEQLLADWGKKGSDYDLNGNGRVDVPDLLMMLRQMASGGSRHRQPISEAVAEPTHRSHRGHGSHRSHAPHMMHGRAAAEHIARTLMNRIDTSDPSRLRETVERSSLAEQQKRLILDRITAMAPRGTMVSVVG